SARHQPVDEFLALIERLADADREVLAELAELASEERLLAGRQPRLALRRLRQLQHLADEEPRQLAQRHARERHRRLQLHRLAQLYVRDSGIQARLVAAVLAFVRAVAPDVLNHAQRYHDVEASLARGRDELERHSNRRTIAYDLLLQVPPRD